MLALANKPRRLLVVEDEPILRRLLARTLAGAGEVVEAGNGKEAWGIVQRESFDAVVSDISMPEMNGVSLLRTLRENGIGVPVLFLSAYESDESVREARRLGGNRFLSKPYRKDEVLQALSELLSEASGGVDRSEEFLPRGGTAPFRLGCEEGTGSVRLYLGEPAANVSLAPDVAETIRASLLGATGTTFRVLVKLGNDPAKARAVELAGLRHRGVNGEWSASGVAIDQTERENFVRNLEEESTVLRDVLSNIPHCVFWKDRNSVYRGANARFLQSAGARDVKEIVGKTDYDMPWTRAEADAYRGYDAELMASGESRLNIEETQLQADGNEVHVVTSKVPLRNAQGEVTGILGIYMDISELRKVQRQVTEQDKRLHAVAKMAALGEMAAGIAHEINNPLAIIQATANELAEGNVSKEESQAGLVVIDKTAERIAKIVSGLRSFSRNEKGDDLRPAYLEDVLGDTLEFCRDRFVKSEIRLELPDPDRRTEIRCRRTEISQVLLNLLNNAVDAVQGTEIPAVGVSIAVNEGFAEIRVRDSGPGVPAALRSKILEPFFTTKGVGKGTGLGLSISLGIVQAHGGSLFLDENSFHTCFVVRLPLA